MKTTQLLSVVLLSIVAMGCESEPKMPSSAVDNSEAGAYNVNNCIVKDQDRRFQLFRNTSFTEGDTFTCEFDKQNRPVRFSDNNNNEVTFEYPDGSTVVMITCNSRDVFHIGKNGFANRCVSNSFGYEFVYTFGYDKDGYLVSVYDDGGEQIIMDYNAGNLVYAKHIDNCGDVEEQCSFTYSDISNIKFGYMPYNLCSSAYFSNSEPFTFGRVYTRMKDAYLAGLIGKPSRMLPDTAVRTDNYGNKTTYYFHNEYLTGAQFISIFRFIIHAYGWNNEEASVSGEKRVQNVSFYSEAE